MPTRKTPRVAIVGAGVVGYATGRGFLARGVPAEFIDTSPKRVAALRREGLVAHLATAVAGQPLVAAVTMICVPTPTVDGEFDVSALVAAGVAYGERLKRTPGYRVLAVRSTVLPGMTEDVVAATVERVSGRRRGRDFGLAMNPEYLREKTAVQDFARPWVVVVGELDRASGDAVAALYAGFDCPLYRVGIREAEMEKYAHNLFNAVKITFFNELRQICHQAGVDAEAIFPLVAKSAEGMWNPAYGIRDRGPFDGMCLPKDTEAFAAWARARGWEMPVLAATLALNRELARAMKVLRPAVKQPPAQPVAVPAPVEAR